MAQLVGQLEIQLLAELSRIQTDMDKAKRAVGNAMSAIDLSVAKAAKSLEDYAKTSGNATDQSIAKAKADAETTKKTEAEKTLAKNQHAMKLIDLNNKIQASNKATADAHAQSSAKVAKDLRDEAAALAAFKTEIQNAELNLIHFGRAKTAAFLQDKGARLGFDPAMVQAEIAGLKKIEAANKAAFAAANPHITELSKRAEAAGTSVKGLSASLRNVPAQFTDIIVSLQGGQAPLTVLLQQGGQLKDMFGGIGNATRALGGYVVGLINPFSLAAASVGTLGYAYYAGSKELDAYNKALILTSNTVGLTSGQLSDMARSMAAVSGTQSKAAEALVAFVNAGATGSANLEKFAAAAIGFEKVTGTAIEETAKQFAELGKNPLEASIKLNESTGFLTMSLYEQVKALDEQGKKTEAAKVAQQAYADTLNQNTAQITANLGIIEKSWNAIASATKGAWDWMMNVGRTAGPQQQLAKLAAEIASKEAMINAPHALEREKNEARRDLKPLRDKYDELSKTSALAAIRATDAAIQAKQLQDKIEWDKSHQSQLDKLQQELRKEVEDYKKLQSRGEENAKTRLQYEQRIHHLVKQEADYLSGEYKVELKKPEKSKAEKVEHFGKELTAAKEWLATQERMLKDSYSTQQKDLEDSFKAQEITAAQYYARQLASDAESLQQREQIRAKAQARFDSEMAKRVAVTQARPESKAKSTALADLENEAKNFAAAQDAARQKDINSMAKHTNAMALEIDKESKKVTGSVDAYIADMQRRAEADAKLLAAREAMAGQAPEIIAGMEAELKVRADAAGLLDKTAEAYAKAAKDAREFEGELTNLHKELGDEGWGKSAEEAKQLKVLQKAAEDARKKLLELGGAVDTTALDARITATAASIKKQTDEVAKEVQKTLADGIMSAGKDGGAGLRKALEDVLVTRPFRIVVEAMLQPVSMAIAQGIMGQSIGGVTGATGFQTALNTASLAMSTFGSSALGAAKAVTMSGASLSSAMTTGAEMIGAGEVSAGSGMIAGAAFPAVAAAVAAKALFDSMQGSVTPTGTFLYGGQGRFGGRQDFAQSGGLFGGGDTKNSSWFDPAPEVAKYMGAVEQTVLTSVKGWAQAIGLSADAVDSYSKQVQVSIGGLDAKGTKEAIDKAFGGFADDMVQAIFGDKLLALSAPGEDASKTLVRLGADLTDVNNVLLEFGKPLFDISLAGVSAAEALLQTVGGLDKFKELEGTLETVNSVMTKLGQSTFEISIDGAKAANDLAKSVGGTAKLSELADGLIHVNENLAKLGEPLLDVSVASAQAAHTMLTATDSAVKAMEAAEKLEASYASFAKNLSKDPDTTQVASLQAIFDRAMANVTKFIPSIKGQSDLTSVTYDQYTGYTDPQRTKLDAAASAFKDLQTAIDSAAKTAESAAKTAQDAAEAASKAYEDALKSVEDSTRDVNRQLRDFGKTDFQKKLSQIAYAGQDKQSDIDKLSAKAAELSATANALSIKASNLSLDSVATISTDLIAASVDLSDSSKEVAGNIKDTLANSTAALGDALTLVPAISSLFDGILAGMLKIPPALILVSNAVQGVGSAASNASGGLTAFGAAAGMAGSSATSATGPVNSVGAAFTAVAPAASASGAALTALGAAFATASAALNSLTGTFNGASSALDGLNASFASASTGLAGLGSAFEGTAASGASLAGSLGAVSGAMEGIAGAAAGAAGGISAAISALSAASSMQAPSGAATAVKAAGGGYIRGPGTTTSDEIPAFLSDKEFVMPADSVEQYGLGFMNSVKNGTLKRPIYRALGGAVTANVDANTQLEYQGLFESLAQTFNFGVQTFTQAMQTAQTTLRATYSIPDTESGIIKAIQTLLTNSQPGADGTFSQEAMASLGTLDKLMPSINTVLATLKDRADWKSKLDVLTGETTERELALKKDLASTTDTTTQNLIRQVYAQEDLNKVREEEAKALDSVKESLKNFQKESSSLASDLASAFGTPGADSSAKSIRKDLALEDVRKTVADAAALQSSPTYAAMSAADKLKTDATIQGIRDTAALAEKQYDLNEARKAEITLLGDAKSRLKSYAGTGASKEVERMRLQGNDAGANAVQKAIDLADVFKSTADATELLKTEGLTGLDIAALNLTISTNKATEAQYDRNLALDAEIEILNRYKSVQEDAAATNIELMRAMGNTAGAAAIELANATKGFNDAQTATVRQTNATKGLIAAYGNLSSTADMVTNSRIGLLTSKGDTAGAAALQREFDIKPYVTAISDATIELAKATTQAEKDILNQTIATNTQAIANVDLSKSLDAEAQAANDAKSAADALASSYADLKKQIENASIELLRASGRTQDADEAAMALALRDHAGDAYYESLYRELLTIQKLTEARGQLNGMEDSAVQNQIKLIRANGGNILANALERSAFLANATAPAAAAQAELNRSNVSWSDFLATKGVTIGTANAGIAAEMAANLASGIMNASAFQSLTALDASGAGGSNLPEDVRKLLYEFGKNQRTDSQQANLQSVVDTAKGIAAAYDLNKSLEGQLKIIELQDEAYKANLDAQKNLSDAQKSYADVLKSTISTMRDFIATLDGGASPLQNLSSARAKFQTVAGKAAEGDTSAYKDLTPAARTFLDLSKNYSKSLVDYQRDEARVRTTLNAVINANQRELDKLPQEIAKAADPTKEAWIKLQEATAKEADTSIMLTALGVDSAASKRRLRTAEESLSDRFLEAVYALDEAKKTPLLKAFNDAIAARANSAELPEYTAFDLGDIWGTHIAGVLPNRPMTNEELNALIAEKFPGMVPSDFLVPLTTTQLSELVGGKFPTLTAENLISTTADVADLVNTQIATILPTNFAGTAFNAQQMMQTAINQAMAAITPAVAPPRPNVAPDSTTTAVNVAQQQALTGGTSGTSTNWSALSDTEIAAMFNLQPQWVNDAATINQLYAAYSQSDAETSQNTAALLLEYKKIKGFAVGTNYVPQDMLAQIHEGEAIIPAPFNPERYNRASGNDALVAEIKALRAEVESLRKSTESGQNAIAANTGKATRLLAKFDIDGMPETRT